jgi:hypothetical protein
MARLVCWWSAGDASAVASAVALRTIDADEKVVAYCAGVEANEHPDNARFRAECERWYGQPIVRLYSSKYRDTWDVYERTGWLVGVAGARCTTELKKLVRRDFQREGDEQVFGFTVEETNRAERFRENNPEAHVRFPLIERGLTKADCHALVRAEGIEPPAMYLQGYKNNNCIGCVKGGSGYWNKIRGDYPEVFARMAALERRLDVAILKRDHAGKRIRVFLDELSPDAGRYQAEPMIECGVACEAARAELEGSADAE